MIERRILRHEYRLKLLPLAVAAIVVSTSIPIELRGAVGWDGGFDYQDFVENMLLFVPLGAALWRRHTTAVLIYATLLSVGAETIQLWSFERYSSPYDVISNVLGALAGAQAWRRFASSRETNPVTLNVTRAWIAAALLAITLLLVLWNLPTRSSAISTWDTTYPLLLGNERTGDRAWRGTISTLTLLPSALTHAESRALSTPGANEMAKRETAYVAPSPFVLDGGAGVVLSDNASQTFAEQAKRNNAFTVITRFETASLFQEGPARLVTFSTDPFHRNFDLGQEGRTLVFRIRTPITGLNGFDFQTVTAPLLQARKSTRVVASYDGAVARIYMDGVLQARRNIAAAGCLVPMLCDVAAPMAWTVFGALLAVIALAYAPRRGKWQLVTVAMFAGGLSFVVLRLTGSGAMDIFHDSWLPLMTLVGAAIVATAASDPRQ